MKVFSTTLQGKEFKIAVAYREMDRLNGLSGTKKLKDNAGMLFVFDEEQPLTFNTLNMEYPLDMTFLNADMVSVDYRIVYPGATVHVGNAQFVLETNANALPMPPGTKLEITNQEMIDYIDDILERTEDENIIIKKARTAQIFRSGGKVIKPIEKDLKLKEEHMQVLDDEGVILMNIKGGERIFSREHTQQLVEMVKQVKRGQKTEEDLGKLMAKIIKIQDNQEPEYVYE